MSHKVTSSLNKNKQNLNSKDLCVKRYIFYYQLWSFWRINSNSGWCTSTVNKYRMQFDSDAGYFNYESMTRRHVRWAFVHLGCIRLSCCLKLSFISIVKQNQHRYFYKDLRLVQAKKFYWKDNFDFIIKTSFFRWTLKKRNIRIAAVPTMSLNL